MHFTIDDLEVTIEVAQFVTGGVLEIKKEGTSMLKELKMAETILEILIEYLIGGLKYDKGLEEVIENWTAKLVFVRGRIEDAEHGQVD